MPSIKPVSVWFIGLPCSGKSTLSQGVYSNLKVSGFPVKIFDGDVLRKGISSDLGFSISDRFENARRVAEINKLFLDEGFIVLNALICPLKDMRSLISSIVGKENFIEVFVDAPLEICEQRDIKGLYKKARAGSILDFTGINSPFESPVNPDVTIKTNQMNVKASVNEATDFIKSKIIE